MPERVKDLALATLLKLKHQSCPRLARSVAVPAMLQLSAHVVTSWLILGSSTTPSHPHNKRVSSRNVLCRCLVMESFFSSLKIERSARRMYHTRDQAPADSVRLNIKRLYNPRRRHSTLGYMSPMEFEMKMRFA